MHLHNPKPGGTILVADDNQAMLAAVVDTLSTNYTVITADNGLQALERVAENPSIICIIMDLRMPHLDGFKTTSILKSNFNTYHIPIIILTSQLSIDDMIMAVQMGADDYMKKPCDPLELQARIIMNLRRTERDQNANPLTKLPGNATINRTILTRLNKPIAILYIDLDNFKAYNDIYGFSAGDKLIIHTASLLALAIKNSGSPSDFLGHIGGDDFIIVSTPEKAEMLAENICTRFDHAVLSFYRPEDQAEKKIITTDRLGIARDFPLASLAIAIVTNEKRPLTSLPEIAQIAAELKQYAKTKPEGMMKSNYVKDQRGL